MATPHSLAEAARVLTVALWVSLLFPGLVNGGATSRNCPRTRGRPRRVGYTDGRRQWRHPSRGCDLHERRASSVASQPGQSLRRRIDNDLGRRESKLRAAMSAVPAWNRSSSGLASATTASTDDSDGFTASAEVRSVEPDRLHRVSNHSSVPAIGGDETLAAGFGGAGQVVAVVDTGVEAAHPMLAGRVVAEACYSLGGDCPGGGLSLVGPGAAVPCTSGRSVFPRNARGGNHRCRRPDSWRCRTRRGADRDPGLLGVLRIELQRRR